MVLMGKTSYNVTKSDSKIRFGFHTKLWVFAILSLIIIILISISPLITKTNKLSSTEEFINNQDPDEKVFDFSMQKFLRQRKEINMSKIGRILFLNENYPLKRDKNYQILVWKSGPSLEKRHINYYMNMSHNPFEVCSVSNCNITYDENALKYADAVVFPLFYIKSKDDILDLEKERILKQRWIFLTDGSPFNSFTDQIGNNWTVYNGVFNWSMSYKMESDIPVPNGRVLPLRSVTRNQKGLNSKIAILSLIPFSQFKRRDILVSIMVNSCVGPKMDFLNELKSHIDVHVYGICGEPKLRRLCPGYTTTDCKPMDAYLFNLVLEEYRCDQYLTDKIFWFAYTKGAIPIIVGPSDESCGKILPPQSYLNVDQYENVSSIAQHILKINRTEETYLRMHEWRKHFSIVNENGYHFTRSLHYCRICEALNYNNEDFKTYNDLSLYLDIDKNCEPRL